MRSPSAAIAVPRLPRLPRPSRRTVVVALVAAAVLVPGWYWLRDSPVVRISDVRVSGVSGPQAAQVSQALVDAAESMTTLDLDRRRLLDAVRQFPIVADIRAVPHPLHRLDIEVVQHVAVAALANGDHRMAVAADGTILDGTLTKGLPIVGVSAPPGGRTLVEPRALRLVALLGAAPAALLPRIRRVRISDHGLTARLRHGPEVYFGARERLAMKWAAATSVLSDYSSRGATYVDVRVPERPAAGGLEPVTPSAVAPNSQSGVETPQ